MPDNLLPANSVHVGGVNTPAAADTKIEKSAPKGLVAIIVFVLGMVLGLGSISRFVVNFAKERGSKWNKLLALSVFLGLIGPIVVLYMSATMITWLPLDKGNSVTDRMLEV
jgi:hypothetical protein